MFKDICFNQGTQLRSTCSSIGLIYNGPANRSFKRQIPGANCFIVIIYYEVFLYFFHSQFFQIQVFQIISIFLRSGVRKSGDI